MPEPLAKPNCMSRSSLPPRLRRPSPPWLAGLLLLAAGCGVSEYEAKMQETQRRVQRFDEESKLLDSPLTIPTPPAKDKNAPPPPLLFVRPPRGILPSANNEKEPRNRILYTFPAKGVNAAGPFINMEVAVGDKSKDFEAEVLRSFSPSGNLTQKQRQFKPPGRDPLTFQSTEFEEGQGHYSVNLWRGQDHQVALVYSIQRGQREKAAKALDASLESFAVGKDVGKARQSLGNPLLHVPAHPR